MKKNLLKKLYEKDDELTDMIYEKAESRIFEFDLYYYDAIELLDKLDNYLAKMSKELESYFDREEIEKLDNPELLRQIRDKYVNMFINDNLKKIKKLSEKINRGKEEIFLKKWQSILQSDKL